MHLVKLLIIYRFDINHLPFRKTSIVQNVILNGVIRNTNNFLPMYGILSLQRSENIWETNYFWWSYLIFWELRSSQLLSKRTGFTIKWKQNFVGTKNKYLQQISWFTGISKRFILGLYNFWILHNHVHKWINLNTRGPSRHGTTNWFHGQPTSSLWVKGWAPSKTLLQYEQKHQAESSST